MPTTVPAATEAPRSTSAVTGWKVVRNGGSPLPDRLIATTPVPATVPAKDTVPPRTARTAVPTGAARSTPRWPGSQGDGGGSNRRSTWASEPPVGSRGDGGMPPQASARCPPGGPARVMASHSSRPRSSNSRLLSGDGGRVVQLRSEVMR